MSPPPRAAPENPNPGQSYVSDYGWGVEFQPILDYPISALRDGVEGWVVVRYIIELDGSTSGVVAVDSSPPLVFDEAAVRAVSKIRFAPLGDDAKAERVSEAYRLLKYGIY